MTKYFKISTIIIVLFVIYAPSCVDEQEKANREEAILNETRNEIRAEFETDYLTGASLFAYETTAKQKLSDFADYLHVLTDTSLDMSFRAKAGEMIKSTFLSENVTLQLAQQKDIPAEEYNVHLLIKSGLTNQPSAQPFSIDSIVIYKPLHRTGNTGYAGSLTFSQNFTFPGQPGQILNSISRSADIHLMKEDKIFGADTLKIWSVQLGEIR
jgi:hypothetical protein